MTKKTQPDDDARSEWDRRLEAARAAVAALEGEFIEQLRGDVARLATIFGDGKGGAPEAGWEPARRLAHDMKGQGEVTGFPIVSKIGESLTHYLARPVEELRRDVVEIHLAALVEIADGGLSGDGGAQGQQILKRLADCTRH